MGTPHDTVEGEIRQKYLFLGSKKKKREKLRETTRKNDAQHSAKA